MRILVDMDGVIANWSAAWDAHALPYSHLGLRQTKDQRDFDLSKGLDAEGRAAVQQIMDHPRFYRDLDVMPGAVEALHKMLELGHDVNICSAPWLTNETCAWDKSEWLRLNFGEDWPRRLILARDKSIVRGEILIDDKPNAQTLPSNLYTPEWTQIYFTQPYNKDLPGYRIDSWSEWESVLDGYEFDQIHDKFLV